MRLLFFVLLIFSVDVQSNIPEPGYGLPELASEARIKELNSKKRAKVMTPSVQRKMQRVLEALDEAGILEQEQALLKKEKKDKEAEAKDKEIAKCLRYLRERVGVPRDMSYPAAMQFRAHLNWAIDQLD